MAEGLYIPEGVPIYEVKAIAGMSHQTSNVRLLQLTVQNVESTAPGDQQILLLFESDSKARDLLERCLSHYR